MYQQELNSICISVHIDQGVCNSNSQSQFVLKKLRYLMPI